MTAHASYYPETHYPHPPEVCTWYALHVCSRHEKVVAAYLTLNIIEVFLPTYKALRLWKNGCRKELDLPLFPGYLFIRIAPHERLKVLRSPGVVGIVGAGGHPSSLSDSEIASLKSGLLKCAAEPYPYFTTGDRIRVRNGAFAGLEGILLRRKKDFRVVLSVNVIARSIAVELDLCDLEPLPVRRWLPVLQITKKPFKRLGILRGTSWNPTTL